MHEHKHIQWKEIKQINPANFFATETAVTPVKETNIQTLYVSSAAKQKPRQNTQIKTKRNKTKKTLRWQTPFVSLVKSKILNQGQQKKNTNTATHKTSKTNKKQTNKR